MQFRKTFILLSLIMVLVLSACASAAPTSDAAPEANPPMEEAKPMDDTMEEKDMEQQEDMDMEKEGEHSSMEEESMANDEMKDDDMGTASDSDTPDWFDVPLMDVTTGQSFTINELQGKVVLVETLAMWCSNCLRQQKEVKELHELLGDPENFISLGVNIDPYEEAGMLKNYVESNGFDWNYVIAGADVSREIGNLYGDQFLNPPSTPMFIIDANGEVHILPFGIKDANSLKEAVEPFLNEAM